MRRSKRFMLGIFTLLLVLIVSACGGSGNGNQTQSSSSGNENADSGSSGKTVKLYNFKVEVAEQLNQLAAEYEKETGVKVIPETCGGGCDYSAGLKTKFSSGDEPDIFFVAGFSDLDLWQEHLEDLSDQPWVSDMVDLAKPPITKEDKIYGMPLGLEGWGFIYNKDLFNKAGITQPPKTLSQLKDAAEKLKAAGITPFENGYAEWWVLGNHLVNVGFAQQQDPVGYIEDVKSAKAKIPGNETLNEWANLVDLTVQYGQKNPLQTDYNTQVTDFANGKAAMMQQGVWTQLQIDKIHPDLNIGFLPMPINDNEQAMDKLQVGVPNYWVVNKNSKAKDEAKVFLNWMVTSDAGKKFLVDDAKFIPAFKSINASSEQLGPLAADILTYTKEGKTLPWLWQRYPGYEANTSQMASQIQAYIGKQITKDQMFTEFQNIWNSFSGK
ncbi:ABC transporter substrate-binding protein [Paenibacillus caui]|uniref:ABC transporter substrate-binding protein n=1 Tax=Paenibacillus caui TaxID=2873927 RepID=UPI001CA8EFDF|nr:ABC transporter substrate-binding protein [Paenibacillus caui]